MQNVKEMFYLLFDEYCPLRCKQTTGRRTGSAFGPTGSQDWTGERINTVLTRHCCINWHLLTFLPA